MCINFKGERKQREIRELNELLSLKNNTLTNFWLTKLTNSTWQHNKILFFSNKKNRWVFCNLILVLKVAVSSSTLLFCISLFHSSSSFSPTRTTKPFSTLFLRFHQQEQQRSCPHPSS